MCILSRHTKRHLQNATSRKIHPNNRIARGTHYRLRLIQYNWKVEKVTYVRLMATAYENRRRRRRVRGGGSPPTRPVPAAQYILISRPFAGVSGSTQIGKLGSMRLRRRNPKPWERDTGRVAPRWIVLPPSSPPRQGRETTSRDRGPADNHCKLPRICSAFRSLTRTDRLLLSTSVLYDYIPFRFYGKFLCRSTMPISRCVPDVIWSTTNFPPVVTNDQFISHLENSFILIDYMKTASSSCYHYTKFLLVFYIL